MSDQPKPTAADQPQGGKDLPGVSDDPLAKLLVESIVDMDVDTAFLCSSLAKAFYDRFPAQPADTTNWKQRAEQLEHDLELQMEVSAELGRQNEQLIGSTTDLPREIQEMIYRSSCCVPTPEAAQKEPCACVAYAIVEKVEEWAGAQATKRAEKAEALKQNYRKDAERAWVIIENLTQQLTAAHERLAKVRDSLTRLAKWAELSPFAESILAEAQAALAEGER